MATYRARGCRFGVLGLCAGLVVPVASAEPRASITAPVLGTCICPGQTVSVMGTSFDTVAAQYAGDTLEYSTTPGTGPWIVIGSAGPGVPVMNPGSLYFWNTAGLSAGTYYLRLTVRGNNALATALAPVVLSGAPAAPTIVVPAAPAVTGLQKITVTKIPVCTGALAIPNIEIGPAPAGPFTPVSGIVDRGPFVEAVINAGALAAGNYVIRAGLTTSCGVSVNQEATLSVDSSLPSAAITSPVACQQIFGVFPIVGTAAHPALQSWQLDYSTTSATPTPWTNIAGGTTSVNAGLLGGWDTRPLPACSYVLRLRVITTIATDLAGNLATRDEYRVVGVGCPADFNRSGVTSVQDVFDFLAAFFSACP